MAKNELKCSSLKTAGLIFLFFISFRLSSQDLEQGYKIFLFVILIPILTDMEWMHFGKVFKRSKLTKISLKTYSGIIGGFILSIVGSLIFMNICRGFKWCRIA